MSSYIAVLQKLENKPNQPWWLCFASVNSHIYSMDSKKIVVA